MAKQSIEEVKRNFTAVVSRPKFSAFALTDRNFALLNDKMKKVQDNWSENNIAFFIQELIDKKLCDTELPPDAAPAAPAAAQAEQLEPWQIPLSPEPSKYFLEHAPKKALLDYLKRAREAAGIRYDYMSKPHRKSQENF